MINPTTRLETPEVDLGTVFPESCTVTLPPGTDRSTAIRCLVETIVDSGRLPPSSAEPILSALLERERFGSSGLWRGFALPHLRTRLVTNVVGAVGMAQDDIDFGTMDSSPTRVIFLVLSPFESRVEHLQVLSRLAAMIQNPALAAVLRSATRVEEICRLWPSC